MTAAFFFFGAMFIGLLLILSYGVKNYNDDDDFNY